MITRRRYNVTLKKKLPPRPGPGADVKVGNARGDLAVSMRAPTQASPGYWWQDWKSATAVVTLVVGVGLSLYFLKGKEQSYNSAMSAAPATASMSPASSPARAGSRAAGNQSNDYSRSNSSSDPQGSTAESFLAFAHGRKGESGGSAQDGGRQTTAAQPGSETLFDGERKVALPENVSGECDVSGGNVKELLGGVSNCFRSHGARVVK